MTLVLGRCGFHVVFIVVISAKSVSASVVHTAVVSGAGLLIGA